MEQFNNLELVRRLQSKKNTLTHIGTASSWFQDEPKYGDRPRSDWGYELDRKLKGEPSCIRPHRGLDRLPRFLEEFSPYVLAAYNLGTNMFRTSFDFGRLYPEPGAFDFELMKKYMRFLVTLRTHGIEPLMTLNHYTMPLWLCRINRHGMIEHGAWEHPDVLDVWQKYVEDLAHALTWPETIRDACEAEHIGPDMTDRLIEEGVVRHFLTFNEPIMVPVQGYLGGTWPPFKKAQPVLAHRLMKTMSAAHNIAHDVLKRKYKERFENMRDIEIPRIGIGYNWQYWDGWLGEFVHTLINETWYSEYFEDGLHSDFLGLHYYFRQTAGPYRRKNRVYGDHPGFGDIHPEGILEVLRRMHAKYPDKDILVAEIGFSDGSGDFRRPHWLVETVRYILDAYMEGIPVKGVLAWSLADCFEWDHGMTQHFGLLTLDELHGRTHAAAFRDDQVTSFKAWQTVANALIEPSLSNLERLDDCAERARIKFLEFVHVHDIHGA